MPTKEAVYAIDDFKAASDGAPGEFTALVSVFGNVDLVGDRVMPGAFTKSLAQWKQSGDPIPVVWSHDAQNPYAHIGYVTAAEEIPQGLLIHGKNDIETNPFAAQAHALMVSRRVTGFSFRYDVINEKRARDGANELLELGLTEVGPTLKGANPDAQLINAKSLLDAAAEEAKAVVAAKSLTGRKVYLDADLPGTFEETRDAICEAASALLNPSQDETVYVYVEATFPTYAIVEVSKQGSDNETFQIAWSSDGETITLGTPVAVDLEVTVTPKSDPPAPHGAKAGARLSQATQKELQGIRTDASALVTRIESLLGTAEDMPKAADALQRDAAQIEADTKNEGQEPLARSFDSESLELRSRIEEMRATPKETSGINSA